MNRKKVSPLFSRPSHVLHGEIFQDLAVVDVPHGLVIPDLAGQQDGAQRDALPAAGGDVDLGVLEQSEGGFFFGKKSNVETVNIL